jgi:transcriptional regulator GlxA family with amidase domain
VGRCEEWLNDHFRDTDAVSGVVANADAAERTVKRRFKAATGTTLMDYVQNLRIEEAKRLLESSQTPFDTIAAEVGYENPGFFRRLFKRRTGLTPSNYRKMFQSYGATI